MTTEPTEEYVKKYLAKAERFLDDAQVFLQQRRLDSAVDRAYYAMFWAARAGLVQKGIIAKTHLGLMNQFSKEYVKSGNITQELWDAFTDAFDARQESTYDVDIVFGEESVQEIIKHAEAFLTKVKELLRVV